MVGVERVSAEALTASLEAVKLHFETGYSLRSGLYTAARRLGVGVKALRMARRLLHLYSVKRRVVRRIVEEALEDGEISEDARILLELLTLAVIEGMEFGDPETLALNLRSMMGRSWPEDVEPYLGVLRSLPLTKPGEPGESHPRWYIRYLERIMGRDEALKLLRFQDSEKPPVYVSLNTLVLPSESILEHLERRGVKLVEDGRVPGVYLVEERGDVKGLMEAVKEGLISIHDFSSQYVVEALGVEVGDTLLDICAAPGTKTWLAAKRMRNRGRIISIDSSIPRLQAHLRRIRRMGVKIVEDIISDATANLPTRIEADKVLVDPPCSSTGLFWREPSYRWIIKPRHVKMFAKLQAKILENSSRHVRRNGILLYSTCSITLEENEFIVEDFLKKHPEFSLVEVEPKLGGGGFRGLWECRRLFPHRDRCNGFFLAKFLRRW